MNTQEFYEAGQLDDAVSAAVAEVKQHPADAGKRALLAELLCFTGDLERADKQLDAVGKTDPEAMIVVSMFRHLLRAETARREFYEKGRLPEFLDKPSEELQLRLEASIKVREEDPGGAAELLARAEEIRPAVACVCDGLAAEDFRDLDDLTGSFFEVLTSNGKYYWIPIIRVETIEFRVPQRPRELLWRPARMVVRGGPDGEVFLPTLYAGSHAASDDRARLGRLTDWTSEQDAPVRGIGQRMYLCGDQDRGILELEQISIDNPVAGEES
jgi:type VI secretion system protein ImpE